MQRTTTQLGISSTMRALIYARFSSNLQNEASVDDQVRVCREFATREGWDVVGVHTDHAISGAVRQRPGLNSLLAGLAHGVDIILTESLDRLSRDQEDIAAIYKRVLFAGARVVTLSEGEVSELHIGLKGTYSALYRKDLADKVRRGQVGRVLEGRNPGGKTYGYRRVWTLDHRGEPIRGLREIDPVEAAVVRRIVREFIDGRSPRDIVGRLNAEGIPSPTGGEWSISTINGDRVRGNGILRNDLYAGRMIHNRTRRVYDPESRRKRIRPNPPEKWTHVDVPELRVISDEDWAAVCARRERYNGTRAEQQRRPKRLLSGLAFCGACGSPWTVIGTERWGCSRAKQKRSCSNARSITTAQFEARILAGLEQRLLAPELVEEFVNEYRLAATELAKSASRDQAALDRRQAAAERKKDRLMRAFIDGGQEFNEIRDALTAAKAELAAIEAQRSDLAVPPVIALHPDLAGDYRRRVKNLRDLLQGGADESSREALKEVRNLIDRITVLPASQGRGVSIELEGRLNAVLELAAGATPTASPAMYVKSGAACVTRTRDPIITNDVLYQLS